MEAALAANPLPSRAEYSTDTRLPLLADHLSEADADGAGRDGHMGGQAAGDEAAQRGSAEGVSHGEVQAVAAAGSASGTSAPFPSPPPRALNAIVPFSAMLLATPTGMYLDGRQKYAGNVASASVLDILATANSTAALT